MAAKKKKTTAKKKRPAMPGAGRPSIRTPEKEDVILRALERGLTIGMAAAIAGIHRRTLERWVAADPLLAESCDIAMQKGASEILDIVLERGKFAGETHSLTWWLMRRIPEFQQPKDQPVNIDTGNRRGVELMAHMLSEMTAQAAAGKIPAATLEVVAKAMEKASNVVERADFEARLKALEAKQS